MKKFYVAALVILVAVGVAVPLWYSTGSKPESSKAFSAAEKSPADVSAAPGKAESEPLGEGKSREQAQTEGAPAEPVSKKGEPAHPDNTPSPGNASKKAAPKSEKKPPREKSSSKKTPPKNEQPAIAVDLAIVGQKGKIIFKGTSVRVYGKGTVLDTLDAAGVVYETSHNSEFVVSVGGQKNSGMSGWMYQVNGKTIMQSAARQKVQPGDCVIWWYSDRLGEAPPQWSELQRDR
ncbi:MAG: DUF4430 domain-containing protein [Firmicutes bacterium]|nr:DUF4430 domain-containing protein [Bacillota bacterium]